MAGSATMLHNALRFPGEVGAPYRARPQLVLVPGPRTAAMTGTEVTLDTLMASLARGDRAAFTGVFEQLWPRTLRLCQGLLGNEADAADAAQQGLAKVFERASQYDPSRSALPWALAIASWECRTILRQRSRRREVSADASPQGSLFDGEDAQVQADLVQAAITALGTLSDTDQETLVSTFWEEAASASGATLRKRRERALERLRNAFRRLYGLD